MPDPTTVSSQPPRPAATRRRGRPSLLLLLLAVTVPTAVALWGLAWWQDRPLRQIESQLQNSEAAQALRQAERFLVEQSGDTRALLLKARALSALGRHNEADQQFRQVAVQSNGFPDDAKALRAWSESLLHLGQWSRAVAIMETLLSSDPTDAELLYRLTVARIRLSQFEPALESASKLAQLPGHEQQANVMIGTIHHDRGNRQAALDVWQSVLAANPDASDLQIPPAEFLAMVGEDLLETGDADSAAKLLQRSVDQAGQARAWALLGRARFQLGQTQQAQQAWQSALQLEPLNVTAREELANAALRNGQPQQAVDQMQPLAEAGNLSSSSAYILQRAYTQLQQPAEATRWRETADELRAVEKRRNRTKELIRNSTDPFWSAYLRAYQLAEQEDWGGAERIVSDLMLQRPRDPHLAALADAIRQRGELPELDAVTESQL